jgi:CheY-like chemotaxis protein
MKKRIKVLVIGDEPDMRFFICNLLGGCGYAPIHAEDRRMGLRKARREKPAVIILDAMMPGQDGLQLFRELKLDPALKGIPVILVSSVDRKSFRQYQRSACSLPEPELPAPGAYLKKPLNAEELIGWVDALAAAPPAGGPASTRPR